MNEKSYGFEINVLNTEKFKRSKTSQSLCILGIPLNYGLFAVLNMFINVRDVLKPTTSRGKKLKSYRGGQPYHIWEEVKFSSF